MDLSIQHRTKSCKALRNALVDDIRPLGENAVQFIGAQGYELCKLATVHLQHGSKSIGDAFKIVGYQRCFMAERFNNASGRVLH